MNEEESRKLEFLPMNELLARFPDVGQTIFEYLDDESLKQSREVCKPWNSFISQTPFYWNRMTKYYIGGQQEFSDEWKKSFKKIPVEITKNFALGIASLPLDPFAHYRYNQIHGGFSIDMSPLHYAACLEHVDIFKYFFERVEEKNPRDRFGRLPIHYAAMYGQLRICKLIHEYGQSLSPQTIFGNTPLIMAERNGHYAVRRFLLGVVGQH